MSETISFDPTAIERLCRLGGGAFAVKMMDLFCSYGAKKMEDAHQAWQTGDLAALAAAAHPLVSSAGNVGAVRVQALAAQVEAFALAHDAGPAGAQLDKLVRAFAEVKIILEGEKTKLAPPSS